MKVEQLTITAGITRGVETEECNQLIKLHRSGESVFGLVDQFQWMPFIVTSMTQNNDDSITFDLRMVSKKFK